MKDIAIDITKGYVALAAIAIVEEVDLKVHQGDQKDRFLQRLHFVVKAVVAIVVVATIFVCAVRRS